jgi:hypothetical protein
MRSVSCIRLALFFSILLAALRGDCCQCGATPYGKTPWETAKIRAQAASVIFEGTPERLDLHWSVLDAKEGDLVPVDSYYSYPLKAGGPRTVVTFRVQKIYKGKPGAETQVSTGLGGGDCAARFTPGLLYLVYLNPTNDGGFTVGMCSPGGWIGSGELAADLRYLRGERALRDDLLPYRPDQYGSLPAKERARLNQQRQRKYEQYQKDLAVRTGRICGTVFHEGTKSPSPGVVLFLSTLGYLPAEPPLTEVKDDGSFCSGPLWPSPYYVYFKAASQEAAFGSYYPGVGEKERATPVEVVAGQTRSNIALKVTPQRTYTVRGLISLSGEVPAGALDASLALIRVGGDLRTDSYAQPLDFQGAFRLLKVKYFSFENVLPGRYIASVTGLADGWFTKKVEVTVSTHSKFTYLELVHKK